MYVCVCVCVCVQVCVCASACVYLFEYYVSLQVSVSAHYRCTPQMVEIKGKIKDVKCGLDGTMFLTSAETLLACGKYVHLFVCLSAHTNEYSLHAPLTTSHCSYILKLS